MRTITEYQPLIFAKLADQAVRRGQRRQRIVRLMRYCLPFVYGLAALRVGVDTGLAPWELGFWLIMAPVILIGEQTLRTVARRPEMAGAAGYGQLV